MGALACSTTLDISGGAGAGAADAGPESGVDVPPNDGCDLAFSTPMLDFGDVAPNVDTSRPFTLTNPNDRALTISSATEGPFSVQGIAEVIQPHSTLAGVAFLAGKATLSLTDGSLMTGSFTVTDEQCTSTIKLLAKVSTAPYLFSGDIDFGNLRCDQAIADQKVSFFVNQARPDAAWSASALDPPLGLASEPSGTIGSGTPHVDLGVLFEPTTTLAPIAQTLTVTIANAGQHKFSIHGQPTGGLITMVPKVLPLVEKNAAVTLANAGNASVTVRAMLAEVTGWQLSALSNLTFAPGQSMVVKVTRTGEGNAAGNTLRVIAAAANQALCASETATITAQ